MGRTGRLKVKRVYEDPSASDGLRVLVDRLWPRGVSKEKAKVDLWLKEVSPSHELRHWYGHDPVKWAEFKRRYQAELEGRANSTEPIIAAIAQGKDVTLLYSSKELDLNNARALAEYLSSRLQR